ncbi:AAA family ATPase [Nocardiopsis ansamitocini]|uniref:AAA+ ATPase domain-containing protein n=1 Tax=Nocardiopsis ansamitocini TaxID=1670832 RepID=A0A9W6P5Y5_9ACTN|nr:AAA family ATPase [Nocardiopsis ansamitocini]GLU48040.1 hypothetical protein Nans01_23910 [Nocardiopsis ansamitocini]
MGREHEPRAAQRPKASSLQRIRAAYDRLPLQTRLLAGLGVLVAAALVAFVAGFPVLSGLAVALMLLGLFAALMRSSAAIATAGVCVLWVLIAYPLFLMSLGPAPILLLLPVLPLAVSLIATRITAFPVWHTTLLSLLLGLILGFAVALTSMITDAVPPAAGVLTTVGAALAALLWRAVAGRRLTAEMRKYQPSGGHTGSSDHRGAPQDRLRSHSGPGTQTGTDTDPQEPVPVHEALAQLEAMIGLDPVKQQVRAIAASIEAARLRADAGYVVDKPLRHLVFSGPPGTGKTSVARTLATIFHSFGLLPSPRVVEAQRADLVGEYLGATAIKTNELVDRALGGVLFIDEAYSLVNDGDGQPDRFGNEAVQTLLKRAEDDRDNLVVILAGYHEEMDRFLASNPGLASRFATRVTFPSYSPDELQRIAEALFDQRGDVLDGPARPELRLRLDQVERQGAVDVLGNGRFARSLVEKAAEARDVRVVTTNGTEGRPEAHDLVTVRAADVAAAYDELTARLPGFAKTPDVAEALAELDALIGLEPVKQQVKAIAAQLQVAKLRQGQGLRTHPPMRHFVFSGPPGTGKTSVARILGRVFASLGLLNRPDVVEVGRADLVGEHLGATAVKTNKVVDRALGGVLFVDEAYSLVNPGYSGGDAFGAEAIQTLLKRAEDDRSRLVIVLAGYPADMDRFLTSNAGLSSRFNVRVAFPSYSPTELTEIAELVADQTGDLFDGEAREDLLQIFGYVCDGGWIDEFGNGRFARSLFEKACSYRDLRVSEGIGADLSAAELTTVTSVDLREAYSEITQR